MAFLFLPSAAFTHPPAWIPNMHLSSRSLQVYVCAAHAKAKTVLRCRISLWRIGKTPLSPAGNWNFMAIRTFPPTLSVCTNIATDTRGSNADIKMLRMQMTRELCRAKSCWCSFVRGGGFWSLVRRGRHHLLESIKDARRAEWNVQPSGLCTLGVFIQKIYELEFCWTGPTTNLNPVLGKL